VNCPRCDTGQLAERIQDGIVVDHCERCRGIWLDRGELEKILAKVTHERASEATTRVKRNEDERIDEQQSSDQRGRQSRRGEDDDDDDDDGGRNRRGRGGWLDRLGGLFD
jgi:uncharacterized protein